MKKKQGRKIQAKVRGRKQISAGVQKEIRKAIEATANRYHCSMAFVQNVALAEFFGIDALEDFRGKKTVSQEARQSRAKLASVVH